MPDPIDFAAAEDHWLDHLAPIYEEMPAKFRGAFHAGRKVTDAAFKRNPDIEFVVSSGGRSDAFTVCASISDANNAVNHGRRAILVEHGAGQSYSDRHSSYPGGLGRDRLVGVLAPNEQAAERHARFYPKGPPVRVVGSPRVDELVCRYGNLPANDTPVVAVSWHWNCGVSPESGTAFYELGRPVLIELLRLEQLGWIKVLGHYHPRLPEAAELYTSLGVDTVESFDEVCQRADAYMVDNSSTLFEFAALDRPVIVVDSPKWRRRTRHGLRFWDYADIGPRVMGPPQVAGAVAAALTNGPAMEKRRRGIIEQVFPFPFTAATEAVRAILDFTGQS